MSDSRFPKLIWLLDIGEITWCDDPDPSGNIDEDDACGYVLSSDYGKLEKQITELQEKLILANKVVKVSDELLALRRNPLVSGAVWIALEKAVKENQA